MKDRAQKRPAIAKLLEAIRNRLVALRDGTGTGLGTPRAALQFAHAKHRQIRRDSMAG
ncbi:MAG: hypothetical protein KIS92_14885 [Planctomycetota bacterium]|nr:hypothetical protein [Planctomycetota bacterium]